jgi:hypothetical protein
MVETGSTQRVIDGKWSSEEQTSDENVQTGRILVPTSLRIPSVILEPNVDKPKQVTNFMRRSVHELSFGTDVSKTFHI